VIGEVPEPLCAAVLERMRARGMKNPVLARVVTPFRAHGDFHDAAMRRVPITLRSDEDEEDTRAKEYMQSWVEQRKRLIIRDALGGQSQLNDVKAVLRFAPSNPADFDWLLGRISARFAENLVYVGDNNEPWIDGDYGHLEPTISD